MAGVAKEQVCVLGSGNWGSVAAKICASNCLRNEARFEPEVRMWTYEEMVDGRKITEIINETHINVKYLPGVVLGSNIIADPDAAHTVEGATLLVFCLPHRT